MERIRKFTKAQPVLVIAFLLAVATMFIVPPDKDYIGYCNRTVLIELFALMAAVAGLRSIGIFDKATRLILQKAGNVRRLGAVMILICFFSAMLVTNDVALITFVPLTLLIYKNIKDERSLILTVVLESAAANLGSMMTPVGNPQNLFLYDKYGLTAMTFRLYWELRCSCQRRNARLQSQRKKRFRCSGLLYIPDFSCCVSQLYSDLSLTGYVLSQPYLRQLYVT